MEARYESEPTPFIYSFKNITKIYAVDKDLPFIDAIKMKEYFDAMKADRKIIQVFYNISTLPSTIQFSINGLQKNWLSWFPNDYHFLLLHTTLYSLHELIIDKKITEETAYNQFLCLYKQLCVPEFFLALLLPNLSSCAHLIWFTNLTESLSTLSPCDTEIQQISRWLKEWRACEDFINNNSIKKIIPQYISGSYSESLAASGMNENNRPNFIGGNFNQTIAVSGAEHLFSRDEWLDVVMKLKKQEIDASLKEQSIFNEKIIIDSSMKELIIKVFNYYYDLKFINTEGFIVGKNALIHYLSKLYLKLLDSITCELRFKNANHTQNTYPFWSADNVLNINNLNESENENALFNRVKILLNKGYQFNIELMTGLLYPNNGMIKITAIMDEGIDKKFNADELSLVLGFSPIQLSKDWLEIHDDNVLRISTDMSRMKFLSAELKKACENINNLSLDNDNINVKYTCNIS